MAISKIRTAEELKNSDLNYFIAFDIAPTETNTKKITDALIAKRNTFARNVNPITARLSGFYGKGRARGFCFDTGQSA